MRLPGTRHPKQIGLALVACAAVAAPLAVAAPAGAGAKRPQAVCTVVTANDSYSTPENTALVVADPGVTSNDTPCGDGLVISTSQPSHGTLANFDDASGGFTYTPDPGFTGTDTFQYQFEDVESPTGTVTITVTAATSTTTSTTLATTTTTVAPTTTAVAVAAQPAFTG
jgi:hypothetical protein